MAHYGRAQYWQQRYSRDAQLFDWYQRYFSLRELIGEHVPVQSRILNVGSGNSRMSEQMFDDGYQSITNIDISQTSIKTMSQKYKQKGPNFKYVQMDVRAMDFAQNSFDVVIDKGTFDSVVCGEGSNTNANKMLSQIYRVLGGTGVYIMITFGTKDNRMQYLEKAEFDWAIKVVQLPKPTITATITEADPQKPQRSNHYVYVCMKGKKNQQAAEQQAPPTAVVQQGKK